jgi:nicotinamidase-related amidase
LEGNAPDQSDVVLLLVDVICDFSFPDGDKLLPRAKRAAQKLAALRERAKRNGVPCIYANDNYGRWRSDFRALVQHCLREGSAGRPIVELLKPDTLDYFVLKPRHSAFYQTCLSVLLEHLQAKTLIIVGFATDSCVTFTATDAYLRGYSLIVAEDGTAACDLVGHRSALAQMKRTLHAQITSCARVSFAGDKAKRKRRKRG